MKIYSSTGSKNVARGKLVTIHKGNAKSKTGTIVSLGRGGRCIIRIDGEDRVKSVHASALGYD